MNPVRKILVAIDGSLFSDAAIDFSLDLAGKYKAKVTAVHVVYTPVFAYGDRVVGMPTKEHIEEGKKILERTKRAASKSKIRIQTKLLNGNPADEICRFAQKEKFDLVVIGSRGLGRVDTLLLGSVSERVSRLSPAPILIVKTDEK